MAGPVFGHELAHVVEELLSVLAFGHVDEIDDDDASHVAEPELARDFLAGTEVDLESVCLLVGVSLSAVAGVYVDNVQSLGVFYDYVSAVLKGDRFAKRRLNLSRDVEMVENRFFFVVELYDFLLVGGDEGDVLGDLREGVAVVDVDVLEGGVEDVA